MAPGNPSLGSYSQAPVQPALPALQGSQFILPHVSAQQPASAPGFLHGSLLAPAAPQPPGACLAPVVLHQEQPPPAPPALKPQLQVPAHVHIVLTEAREVLILGGALLRCGPPRQCNPNGSRSSVRLRCHFCRGLAGGECGRDYMPIIVTPQVTASSLFPLKLLV